MAYKRLALLPLVLLDLRACLCTGEGPIHASILEQFTKKIVAAADKTASAPAGSQSANAVKHLAVRNRREANALVGNRTKKFDNPWFGPGPHHPGGHVRAYEPRGRT